MRLFTPPVVAILMTSAPRPTWMRTASRQLSTPLQTLSGSPIISRTSSDRLRRSSIWPEVVEMALPASMMRGPAISCRAVASRSARVTPPLSPRFRTVVKPAIRVSRALPAAS